jgi:hypothetical protein
LVNLVVASAPGALLSRFWENVYHDHLARGRNAKMVSESEVVELEPRLKKVQPPKCKPAVAEASRYCGADETKAKDKPPRFKPNLTRTDESDEESKDRPNRFKPNPIGIDEPVEVRMEELQRNTSRISAKETSIAKVSQPEHKHDFSRAVKADDAEAPTFLWDNRIWNLGYHDPQRRSTYERRFAHRCPLTAIRGFCLRWW